VVRIPSGIHTEKIPTQAKSGLEWGTRRGELRDGIVGEGDVRSLAAAALPLRMTIVRTFLCVAAILSSSVAAWGTTYYVSSSLGSDTNAGTSAGAPWQTLAQVNAQTFNPGDSILFKRGDVWNESLAPPSSGSSGNPITFDAYGTGPAPNFTGYYAIAPSSWANVTGNAWKAKVPSTFTTINFCLFGSIWGQKVSAVTSNLTAQWDFYLANGYLYVYSVGNPSIFYSGEPIVPMALSNVPVININSQTWLRFQHILVNWFDDYGVYVQGTSDHLVFANMEADSMIPEGTQPLGFYVDESAPGPGDIKIYNFSAHLNYDGFRFDGSATAIAMVNDNAYANRDGALVDNTGAVTYSYCHFYASSLAVAGSTDVEATTGPGPTLGARNIPADTPTAVQVWQRYPARVTLTVDDSGMTQNADTYYAGTVLPVADAAGVPVGAAITVGYPLAQTLISEFQSWINAGRDVTAHSMSHTYYTNTDALDLQYTGSGTAASLSVSNKVLTITVTGASDSVSYNLAQGDAQGTIGGLNTALFNTGKFTTSFLTPCQGPYGTGCSAYTFAALLSQDLADVSNVDVKTSPYHMQLDVTRLTTDEITLSRQWMTTNLTGLPATPVYVYPGGYEDPNMEAIAAGVPYVGARGALHEGGTANNGTPITGAKDTYASGINVEDITSFGVNPSWQGSAGAGVTPTQLNQKIQALVWKEQVWGVPWGVFWHNQELIQNDPVGGTEITNLIQDFKGAGATVLTNTALVNWITAGTLAAGVGTVDGNYYYKSPAASAYGATGGIDFRPTVNSPVVDAGSNLGTAYEIDINGVNQNSYGSGWEIGAHTYIPESSYSGGAGSGPTSIGGLYATNGVSMAPVVYPGTPPNIGGQTGAGTTFVDPTFGAQGVRVTDVNFDPSMTGNNNQPYAVSNGGSEDDNWFNTIDTLTIVTNQGDRRYLVGLNPATLAISRPYATNTSGCPIGAGNCSTNGGWAIGGGALSFSLVNPYLLYVVGDSADGTALQSYTFDGPAYQNPPSAVTVEDYNQANGNCLPTNFGTSTWQSDGGVTTGDAVFGTAFGSPNYYLAGPDWTAATGYTTGTLIQPLLNNPNNDTFKVTTAGTSSGIEPNWNASCGASGNTCSDSNGVVYTNLGNVSPAGQNTGYYVVVWSPSKGCMAYNTKTGAIRADVGWAGGSGLSCTSSQCTGTSTSSSTFTIHNVKLSKTGAWITLAKGTTVNGTSCSSNNPQTWIIGTTTVFCAEGNPSSKASGHWANGALNFLNDPGEPLYQFWARTESGNEAGSPLAVNNVPTSPACTGSTDEHASWNMTNSTDTTPFGFTRTLTTGLMPYDAAPCAWVAEVDMADPPGGDGVVHRQALTYNTGQSVFFDATNNIATFSQDGEFASIGTDWLNTLGNAPGTSASCVANGPNVVALATKAANYVINPVANNTGNYSFQNESGASCQEGTSPTSIAWPQTVGATQSDGTCTWTNIGVPTGATACRTDVVLWKLNGSGLEEGDVRQTNFGMQCGLGQPSNCQGSGSTPITWPQTLAQPGLLRLHDSGTYWAILNPANGVYNWTNLDNWLDAIAQEDPIAVSQVFTWVPCWDAPACSSPPTAPTGTNAPPNDLVPSGSATFNAFVTAFVNHCSPHDNCVKNLIKYYEMWNEWDIAFHWTGTMAQVYQMAAPAAAIIRANVPGAVILMPSTTPASATYQADFKNWLNYETANGRISDWVDWHVYLTNTNTTTFTPEEQWNNYNQNFLNIQRTTPGWATAPWADTETNFNGSPELEYTCPTTEYTAQDCAGQVVRWQILHDSNGAAGVFWYYWNTTIGGNSQNETAYYWMMQYMVGGYFPAPATYTTTAGVQTWIAPFVEANGTRALWIWTPSETGTSFLVPAGYGDYRDLGGGITTVSSGQSVAIGVQPILLEQ
jgi:hypothetical protein